MSNPRQTAVCKHGNEITLLPSYNTVRCAKCDAEADAERTIPVAAKSSTEVQQADYCPPRASGTGVGSASLPPVEPSPASAGADLDWLIDTIAHCTTGHFDVQMFRSAYAAKARHQPSPLVDREALDDKITEWFNGGSKLRTTPLVDYIIASGLFGRAMVTEEELAACINACTGNPDEDPAYVYARAILTFIRSRG